MVSLYLLQMNYQQLWQQSSSRLQEHPTVSSFNNWQLFTNGARWMHAQLDDMSGAQTSFDEGINFAFYGWIKYSVSLTAGFLSALLLVWLHPLLLPLAILVFYFCEVQLLFLFPLLIDKVPNPVYTSIRQTAAIGTWKIIKVIIPIGIRMLLGLLNVKAPLRNWYTGCLAILIWYKYEVRNRLQ